MAVEQTATVAAGVASFFDELVAGSRVPVSAMMIAQQVGHPIYDCFYLAVADLLNLSLLAADAQSLNRLRRTERRNRGMIRNHALWARK
jgi:predicted nucleic acid-binding protein